MGIKIMIGDVRERLKELPDESVHCVVTSPPYYGLRDYGIEGQIGLEETPAEYVEILVAVFREVRRVLRKDGTVWLNLGDCYNAGTAATRKPSFENDVGGWQMGGSMGDRRINSAGLKPKDLLMIPAQVALALRGDGWYLRSEIIWAKPNPMPESVNDRPTSAHEKMFLLSRASRYFYDAEAVRERATARDLGEMDGGAQWLPDGSNANDGRNFRISKSGNKKRRLGDDYGAPGNARGASVPWEGFNRNLRNVWTIATAPFPEAHFATFPPALVEPCIKAGTSEKGCCPECGAPWVREVDVAYENPGNRTTNGPRSTERRHETAGFEVRRERSVRTTGWSPCCSCRCYAAGGDGQPHTSRRCTVLDPFAGAGTVGLVADRLGRDAILVELKPEYAAMAEARLAKDAGLFGAVETV